MKIPHIIFILIFWQAYLVNAQSPVIKVDLNMSGRPDAEVLEPGYTPWAPEAAASVSKTVSGITFTFKKTGSNGTTIRPSWAKADVQTPVNAQLVGDGIYVDGGDAGAQIELTISGLVTGTHTFLTYHNAFSTSACAPMDISVNGVQVVNDLSVTSRATKTASACMSYLTLNAISGKSIVILFKAETTSSAALKNVFINGFELNTGNPRKQSRNPIPEDADEHIDPGTGSLQLKWEKAPDAVSHRVYFGTDKSCVTDGTTTSSCYKGSQTGTTFNVTGIYSMDTYYWRVDEVDASGLVSKGAVWSFRPRQLAFPDAEGYGRYARGGRGGKVIHVTNLNDSGAGSLRDAVENQTGPRTIVFDVSGIITLESRLVLSDPYVTVAGQTAPGKGICLRKAPFGFTGNDVVVRHLRLRLGGGPTYDGMGMTGANNTIMDHCSISWTIDEAFSSRSARNITLQRTLISEALNVAGHQNYPAGTAHGYAGTISGRAGSYHHNLLAHCEGRNFSMGSAIDGGGNYDSRLDIFNNVVYNYGGRATDGQVHKLNFVNNYYKRGAATKIDFALSIDFENYGTGTIEAYYSGNIIGNADGSFLCDGTKNTCGRRYTLRNGNPEPTWNVFPTSGPLFPSYATIQSAKDAYKDVLSDVGQNQPMFDDHDIRMVNETLNGTYKYKGSKSGRPGLPDNESDVGGYESYPSQTRAASWDTDKDGLPDFWEKAIGTNTTSPSGNFSDSNADPDKDGYTNLDDFLNWMAEPHYFVTSPSTQTVDLAALFRGYSKTSPTYTVASVVNGSVTISGSTATFKPSACGFASFNLTVKDNAGATMTKKVGVFVDGSCTVSNIAPVVSITGPANNTTFVAGTSIELTANVTDGDGTISKVEFYNGATLIGTTIGSPYKYTWTNVIAGTYTITAVATDGKGSKTPSLAISIIISAKPTDCAGVENGTAVLDDCDRCVGGTTGKASCAGGGEAEDDACSYDGTIDNNNAGFKGSGFINVPNAIGSQITFKINAVSPGNKLLSFRYASGGTSDRTATVYVNGLPLTRTLSFPATGAFTTYKSVDLELALNAGTNNVQLVSTTADGLANIDQIGYVSSDLSKADCDVITSVDEAQKGTTVSIYPNPSSTNFHISLNKPADIEITNAEGNFLESFVNVSELEFGNDLRPGIYFLKVESMVYKFVKY